MTETSTATMQSIPPVNERDSKIAALEKRIEQLENDGRKMNVRQSRSEGPRMLKPMTTAHELFVRFGITAEECERAAADDVPHDRDPNRRLSLSARELHEWATRQGIKSDHSPDAQFDRLLERRMADGENRRVAARHVRDSRKNGRELYQSWLSRDWPECPVPVHGLMLPDEACRALEISPKELGGLVSSTRGGEHIECLDLAHALYWKHEEEAA